MKKPTSLAAQLRRDDEATARAHEKENAEVASRPASEGKVWVRLARPHYDSNNVLHMPGIVELDEDAVPSSAKVLTPAQAEAALVESDDE